MGVTGASICRNTGVAWAEIRAAKIRIAHEGCGVEVAELASSRNETREIIVREINSCEALHCGNGRWNAAFQVIRILVISAGISPERLFRLRSINERSLQLLTSGGIRPEKPFPLKSILESCCSRPMSGGMPPKKKFWFRRSFCIPEKLPIDGGRRPNRRLLERLICPRFGEMCKLPVSGNAPVRRLSWSSTCARSGRPKRPLGMDPLRKLSPIRIRLRDKQWPSDSGIGPKRKFPSAISVCSLFPKHRSGGRSPLSLFVDISRSRRRPFRPSCLGMLPVKLFSQSWSTSSSGKSPMKSGMAP
ncbi:hypothetical protein IEQ34_003941 [Dendrobium chrysotoxum]|uniref:Uncharacterized protein n=1 Tax=Dendrobium chrysotoxum TaxID=161865 RepID=A0AAV7HGT1_DENCH|nr:hypothetical protein IEQ34_003941 [Dendrobium chrysotoxum]